MKHIQSVAKQQDLGSSFIWIHIRLEIVQFALNDPFRHGVVAKSRCTLTARFLVRNRLMTATNYSDKP